MTLHGIPEALSRAQAYRESLMRLGFVEDQIKISMNLQMLDYDPAPGEVTVTVGLWVTDPPGRPGGDFVITCGSAPPDWLGPRFIDAWNALTQAQRQLLYDQYQPWPMIYDLCEALVSKGIAVPQLDAMRVLHKLRHDPASLLVPLPATKDRN